MPFVSWNDDLLTGLKEADEQHKRFIEILNRLYDSMVAGKGRDVIDEILDELVRYSEYHFETEEKYMARYGYPALPAHKSEHDFFRAKIRGFVEQKNAGKLTISIEVMNFLKDWLLKHIMQSDKKYGPFILEKMKA